MNRRPCSTPRSLGDLRVSESERARHIGWDIGIGAVSTQLADALGARMVAQRYSRLVIDCNAEANVPYDEVCLAGFRCALPRLETFAMARPMVPRP
jgi:hypothetical protein